MIKPRSLKQRKAAREMKPPPNKSLDVRAKQLSCMDVSSFI